MITWTGAAGADSYNVYRRVDPERGAAATPYVKLTTDPTKNNFFTDTGLTNGQVVRYVVTGLVGGEETAASIHQVAVPTAPIVVGTANFFTQNIDTKSVGATQVKADGQLEITASGAGINHSGDWTAGYDAFRFLAAPVDGNATLTVKVTGKPTSNQDRNQDDGRHLGSGIGLMVREGLAPNARYGVINATLGAGVQFQGRTETAKGADVSADGTDDAGTTYPLFLRIQRAGDTIRGFQSTDGTTFTQVGEDLTITGLKAPVYVGIAVSNGFEGFTMTADVDPKSIKLE